jgi:hypothetical protein
MVCASGWLLLFITQTGLEQETRVMIAFQSMRNAALALFVVVALATQAARADWAYKEGGLKDLSTGLVWSESLTELTDSWWTWDGARNLAANYSVDGYADWRLPTRNELLTATDNGTIQLLLPGSTGYPFVPPGEDVWSVNFWTSERKGNKAYAVQVFYDVDGVIVGRQVILLDAGRYGFAIDAFMVRP